MAGFFANAQNVDARGGTFNSVAGDQTNHYAAGWPYPAKQINQRRPTKLVGGDHPSWEAGNSDPPSFTPGHPDPPSWSQATRNPTSWANVPGIPAQSKYSTESPNWMLPPPERSATIDSATRSNRPMQNTRSRTLGSHMMDDSSLSYASLSIIHRGKLRNSKTSLDSALSNCENIASPWNNPSEYITAEADYISTILQETRVLTGRVEVEQASFTGQPMIYSRLIAYIFAHLMLCADDERILYKFTQSLQQWRTWSNVTRIQNHQLIKDYLQGMYQQLRTSPSHVAAHPDTMFRKLLTLDAITLSAHLTAILMDNDKYKELVGQRGEAAQSLLDLLQARLDIDIHPKYKPRHIKALITLSKQSGLVPDCLILNGVEVEGDAVAAGGFGDVYKGRLKTQEIALKVLKVYQKSDMQKLLKDFSCEAVTWRQLSHPNVLPFYGVFHLGKNPSRLCLASPWLDNGNVVQYLAERAPKTNCVPLTLDIAQGLEYLHGEKIIHGDMKGLNILISRSGRACLADFGLAIARDSRSVIMSYITTNRTTGTLRWQAPELFPDMNNFEEEDTIERRNTMASDIYAYGLVCYEMFSEQYPFPDISLDFQVMFAVKQGKRPSRPSHEMSRIRGLNDEIWHIIEACWTQDPDARPSATKVLEYLRNLPNRPLDSRPLNDFDKLLTSQALSMYDRADHPFATLAASADDSDELQNLKWVSREF